MPQFIFQSPAILFAAPVALLPLLLLKWPNYLPPKARYSLSVLRILALLLLVMSLARPFWVTQTVQTVPFGVVILRDVSDSIKQDAAARDAAVIDIRQALSSREHVDLLDFASAAIATESKVDTSQTNIQAALESVFNRTASEPSSHVVIVSDGRETQGDATRIAGWFEARGGRVHTLGIGQAVLIPPQIRRIEPSNQNEVGRPVRFTAIINSPVRQAVKIILRDDKGRVLDQRNFQMDGDRAAVLSTTPADSGLIDYRLELQDGKGRNLDSMSIRTFVSGPPTILIVDPFLDELEPFKQAISPLKLRMQICTPDALPSSLEGYPAIILSDLSGSEFTTEQRQHLRTAVEHGTGLLFVGGSNCVPARWLQNSVADVLPIEFLPPKNDNKKKRQLTVCYVIDRSGSMNGQLDSTASKLDLVKAAIHASLRDLPEEAKICVIVFDSQADIVVPSTPVSSRNLIDPLIDRIQPGGGTNIAQGIGAALDVLINEPGEKYMIVLTDGNTIPPPAGWDSYTRQSNALGVSWTSIAVGSDADQMLMKTLATTAGGQYFYCGSGSRVPKVFISQARKIADPAKMARLPFVPKAGKDFDALSGIRPDDLPQLTEAMDTRPRQGTQIVLTGRERAPVLSRWRFGLGNVAAFTSSSKSDWAPDWISWKQYPAFWSQILQWCLQPPSDLIVKSTTVDKGKDLTLLLNVMDSNGKPVSGLSCNMENLAGNNMGSFHDYDCRSPREGLYEISLHPTFQQRTVSIRFSSKNGNEARHSIAFRSADIDEARVRGVDETSLRAISDAGGGIMAKTPAEIIEACKAPGPKLQYQWHPLSFYFAAIVVAAWFMDVLVRKMWT